MQSRVDLTLFAHAVSRPDDEVDLAQAALLVATLEYPNLDVAAHLATLRDFGRRARLELDRHDLASGDIDRGGPKPEEKALRVVPWMYESQGFRGNAANYYDPRNSFLNDVLERRVGIPISLAVVLLDVLHTVQVPAFGIAFPARFLVRIEGSQGSLFVDPFEGSFLGRANLEELAKRGGVTDVKTLPKWLVPATKRQILTRMLNNLRGIYAQAEDVPRLRAVLERLHVLAPSKELERELEKLGGATPWISPSREIN